MLLRISLVSVINYFNPALTYPVIDIGVMGLEIIDATNKSLVCPREENVGVTQES